MRGYDAGDVNPMNKNDSLRPTLISLSSAERGTRPQAEAAAMRTRTLSVARTNTDKYLIEKICLLSLESGECFFCTGPETD